MKQQNNRCPKCGRKLSPFYLKQTCPGCGVNLMYYRLDERLEEDAENAAAEVERVDRFVNSLRASTVKTPLHILRLILFFTPLASMCLPMYYAAHKKVSLITLVLSIVNHGLDTGAIASDKGYLFAVLAILSVILLSLGVIIGSLFSAGKRGFRRNIIFSAANSAAFGILSVLVCVNGGSVKAGFYVTALIYAAEALLHYAVASPETIKRKISSASVCALCAAFAIACALIPGQQQEVKMISDAKGDIRVVSFNTAAPWGTSLDGTGSADRVKRFVSCIKSVKPDLLGTQELNKSWLETLESELSEYGSYAVERGGDEDENRSEMNGIFWLKSRFEAVEEKTFWLSKTPDTESRFTYTDENGEQKEAGCNRICTYALLRDKTDGALTAFMNTHLDNSSEEAMNFGAELIVKEIGSIRKQYKEINIILSGDFNQTEDGIAYKTVSAVLNDTTDASKAKATWQDWGYTFTGDKPIDFIFTSGKAADYEVLDDLSDGYISDHYGVMADIDL